MTTRAQVLGDGGELAAGPALDRATGSIEAGDGIAAAIGAGLKLAGGRLEHDLALYGDLVGRRNVPARNQQAEVGLPIRTLLLTLDIEKDRAGCATALAACGWEPWHQQRQFFSVIICF